MQGSVNEIRLLAIQGHLSLLPVCIIRDLEAVTSAGSVRPHLGMGARAPPVAASQVTPSQAVALIDRPVSRIF